MHSKYLQLKKNCENISKSQHSRDKLARKWVKKTLGNEKKPVYKYIPDYLWAWYNIEKESNHQKKKKRGRKALKWNLKKTKQKKKQAPQESGTAVSWYNAQPTELRENCHEIESKFKSICIKSTR